MHPSVMGAYWITSRSALRYTTFPGVQAQIAPDLERSRRPAGIPLHRQVSGAPRDHAAPGRQEFGECPAITRVPRANSLYGKETE